MSESLKDRIHSDMVAAMKAREKDRVSVLRMLTSVLKDEVIKHRVELDDQAAMKILLSYAKKREETLAEMLKAGRQDLADKERLELEIVQDYLPQPMSEEELDGLVRGVIAEVGATSIKDMGAVMKAAQERVAGRAPGAKISALVKTLLAS